MSTGIQSENGQISDLIDYLMERNNMTVTDLAAACDIPRGTLYSILQRRNSSKADLHTLKKVADYFGEDINIFLGLNGYERPIKLTPVEKKLIKTYRKLTDAAQGRIDGALEDAAGNPKNLR